MHIVHLAAGAGAMYCGACARDAALVRGLQAHGQQVEVIPLYTPLRQDHGAPIASDHVFLGGINAYLQQMSPLFRHAPRSLDRLFDHPALLRWAGRFAVRTRPEGLGPMTVSVLRGAHGRQRKEMLRLLDRLAEETRPDVVSITNSLLSGIAPLIRDTLCIPVVCGFQGEDSFLAALPQSHRDEALELIRANLAHVDYLTAPCEEHATRMAALLHLPRSRIQIVPVGIDPDVFGPPTAPPAAGPLVIGYLSAITPGKGLDLLVEAFVALAARGEQALLRVAGKTFDEGYRRALEKRIRSAGLEGRYDYLGEIGFEAKREFLRECALFCLPSRQPEARAVAAMEAMAAGRAVVAPRHGVFVELVGESGGGLLFEPDSSADLACALQQAAGQRRKLKEMGQAGREHLLQAHTLDHAAEAMLRVLRPLTAPEPAPD